MLLQDRFLRVVDRFLTLLSKETGFDTIVCDETGTVVRATVASRVGTPHAGAQRIVRHECDEYLVTAAEAAQNPLVQAGMNCPIIAGGRRVGTFGIAGPPETTRPLARLASVLLANWLEELQREAAPPDAGREARHRGRVLWIHGHASPWVKARDSLREDYDLIEASDAAEGLSAARAATPDVVLCDYDCADTGAADLLVAMNDDHDLRGVPLIVLSTGAHEKTADGGPAGDGIVPMSLGAKYLKIRVGVAVRMRRMYQEIQAEQKNLGRMITQSARSEARLRAVIESALDGIVLLGAGGEIEGLNAAAERMFGWSQGEVGGRDFLETFVAPGSRAAVAEALEERGSRTLRSTRAALRGLRRDGQEFPMECNFTRLETGSGTGRCAFTRDVTESQRLQMELQQAQKLEAVGQLAAGIAHEINTPIQFIGDNTQFLQDALSAFSTLLQRYAEAVRPDAREPLLLLEQELDLPYLLEEAPKTVARTLQGVQRVATIVRAMKEFAHPDQREMVATDLNRALQATLEVARNEYKYVADVETDLADLPLVTCHAGDMNQVFLNIVVNAAHAVGDVVRGTQDKGKIRITSRRDGDHVVVSITDTGTGIPDAIRGKVYDPFFTTKGVGRGTGQGLAIARTIVAKHRGKIHFETERGKGTTFFIRIPVKGHDAEGAAA